MEAKHAITLIVALIGAGGFLGYWIIRGLKVRYDEIDRRQARAFRDREQQLELLRAFLGRASADFTVLHNVAHTHDPETRQAMIKGIRDWIDGNRPRYPDDIQDALVRIGQMAGPTCGALPCRIDGRSLAAVCRRS